MISKFNSLIFNPYIFSIFSKICLVLIGFLFTVAQARYLGAEIKGQISYITSITSIFAIILGFGLHQAYPFFKKNTDKDILPVFLKIALLQFFCFLIVAICLSFFYNDAKIVAVFIMTPLMVYNRIISYISMIENPNRKNFTELIINLVELLFVFFLWLLFSPSFLIGALLISFKELIMAVFFTFPWINRVFSDSTSLTIWFIKLIKFGFFPMIALLMTTLNYRVDIIMLEGRVADELIGVYSIGVMLAERIWLIPDALKEVMVSKIAKGKGTEEVSFVIRICNTSCLFVALVLILFGRHFINVVFGSEYDGAYEVTLILLTGVFLMIYYKMIASYNIIIGKQIVNFVFLGISVFTNVIANIFMIPTYGIYGAGIASVISYGICSFLFLVQFHNGAKISIRDMLLVKASDLKKLKQGFFRKER